ncbi:hypothetical protein P1X15_29600 [Runella sp. MFBS21]|uniref:hypothetical protein n=1 Tax=Runella sp. MFBS21 TaxID=3034018 RepID=UPI0023F948B3|nr:hypothetical protein [Runella sp. MFBS21]MDF7821809.1 hypothetical protein [Runella sp. MFBS21]
MVITKKEFMALASGKYEKLQNFNQINDFYAYKKEFEGIWDEFGEQSLEKNISNVPKNPQKNIVRTRYGKIDIDKTHSFSESTFAREINFISNEPNFC